MTSAWMPISARSSAGAQRLHQHVGNADDGDVVALRAQARLAERHFELLFGHIGVGEIKQPMLDEDHRIVVANGVDEAALGVIGIGRRHDFQPRHVHEHGVQTLRMLRALPPGFADHAAHDQRHLDLAVIHVAALGRDIDELVHAQHEEVHADMDVNRPHPGHGRADGDAGHGIFRQRRAKHPFRTEDIDQAAGRSLDRLVVVDVETKDENARVALHLLRHRFAERIDIGQQALVTRRRRHWCTAR